MAEQMRIEEMNRHSYIYIYVNLYLYPFTSRPFENSENNLSKPFNNKFLVHLK